MNEKKLDPDLLLQDIKQNEASERKGKLKIFLGMCPGVGKTFSMLKAAHQLKLENIDVVVGVVETHSRAETLELTKNLEIIPRLEINYKGTMLNEMDIDSILKRKPKIVLVDELAHTNIPGSRHPKRYLDVLELLDNGIDVYTTVNIQHIETRSTLVTQITGITIQETVPDVVITEANQVELIDITPDELLKRLKDGKVYLGERAHRAMDNFFKIEHLIALREIALRFTAEIVDQHLRIEMGQRGISGPWNTNERLLVAFSHSPYSQNIIRATRRMAFNLEAPWIALYINNQPFLSNEDQDQLDKNIALAKELGAEFITIQDFNIVEAIKRVAIQRNVSQIILGRPDRRISDIFNKGTILERLTREASNIDIHVLRQERKNELKNNFRNYFNLNFSSGLQDYYNAFWLIGLFSLISYSAIDFVGYRSVGFIYLFLVLTVSSFAGRGPIIFTAFLSAFIWDYFFIPPRFTFHITQKEDIMLCCTYLLVAMVTGYLAYQRNKQKYFLIRREESSNTLYRTIRDLNQAKDITEVSKVSRNILEHFIPVKTHIFLIGNDTIEKKSITTPSKILEDKDYALVTWSAHNKKSAGWSTEILSSSRSMAIPIMGQSKVFGVILIEPLKKFKFDILNQNTLESILSNINLAFERLILMKENEESLMVKQSEKLHQSLLNSISHELKTPITSIVGVASSLKQSLEIKSEQEVKLMDDLVKASFRLNRVVSNLLDMSRLNTGHLQLNQEYFEIKELVENVIISEKDWGGKFTFNFPEKDFFILGDTKLIEHTFYNLCLNAIQYSPVNEKINIEISNLGEQVSIKVSDRGIGINEEELDKIFDRFYRAKNSKPGGTGLGLSIVKEVIEMHGGTVRVFNNEFETGCTFEIKLKYKSEI